MLPRSGPAFNDNVRAEMSMDWTKLLSKTPLSTLLVLVGCLLVVIAAAHQLHLGGLQLSLLDPSSRIGFSFRIGLGCLGLFFCATGLYMHRKGTLPEFAAIGIFRPNPPIGENAWEQKTDGKFARNWDLAADPVFDIIVKYEGGNTLVIYNVGVRLLERLPGEGGGTMGTPPDLKVHAELEVDCPQRWKQILGTIDEKVSAVAFTPKELSKENPRFRFTLMLKNFCDKDNSTLCKLKFCLETEHGVVESRSICLSQ